MLTIDNSNPYLTFQDMTPEGRKTRIVEVIAVRDGALLGTIKWFGRWRQYVFAPEPGCVFNVGCLDTIQRNVGFLTDEWRTRASAPAVSAAAVCPPRRGA